MVIWLVQILGGQDLMCRIKNVKWNLYNQVL